MPLATQLIFYQTNFPGETIKQPFCRTRNFFSNFLQYPFPIKKKYTLVVEYLSLYTSILSLFLSLKRIFIKNFKILMILFKACPINIRIFSLFLNNIYISITRGDRIILVDGTVSSRVKPTGNGVCVHQNRWPALESCQVVEICRYNLVLFSSPSTLLPGSRSLFLRA